VLGAKSEIAARLETEKRRRSDVPSRYRFSASDQSADCPFLSVVLPHNVGEKGFSLKSWNALNARMVLMEME
jgi:hypothetical protein